MSEYLDGGPQKTRETFWLHFVAGFVLGGLAAFRILGNFFRIDSAAGFAVALPVSSLVPDTNAVVLMAPEAPEVGAFTLPVFAGSTNELLEILPGPEWQSFDYTVGTTQWVFFTLTQRTDLSVYLDQAAPDTLLLLYGPDSTTNLSAMIPADLSGRVVDTANSNGVPGVLVHFSVSSFGFASVPAPVFTRADGRWSQTGFQKSNITGMVTYQMAATLNTNFQALGWGGPSRESLPGNPNPWIISEAIYSPPTAGNVIAVNSQSPKTDRNFLLTRFKYPLDYTLAISSNLNLTASQTASISNGLRSAANYMYDATDGQVLFRDIRVLKSTNDLADSFKKADIQICPPLLTNRSHVATLYSTNNNGVITTNKQMRLDINDCGAGLYATFVHELGHLEFNLQDEYTLQLTCTNHTHVLNNLVSNTNTQRYDHSWGFWVDRYKVAHTNLFSSCPPCIMDGNVSSEFCKPGTHKTSPVNSQQYYHTNSCWETMKIQKQFLVIPSGSPLPGPGATGAKFDQPLPGDQSAARHVRVLLP